MAPAASIFRTLLRLTEAVGRASTLDEIYDAALTGLREALGVTRASILLFDADGVMRFKAWCGLSDAYRAAVEGHTPWAPGAEPSPPILVSSTRNDDALAPYRPLFEREGISALAFIPLVAANRVIGKFMLYYGEPHEFSDEEITVALTLGYQIGFAVERKHAENEHARLFAELQQASRVKDEFLSTLSHELRTPLTTILGWSNLLRSGAIPPARISDALATIDRNARAQSKLIDEILDVARITSGKLALDIEPLRPVEVLANEIEAIRPLLDEKRLRLAADLDPAAAAIIQGDPARIRQVAWNLLSNAVKFTDADGEVRVSARVSGGQFEFTVEDTGCGITPDFLPHVFDRFRQADGTVSRTHGGLGLGLSITRDIVELHGGTIAAESAGPARGARFVVRLPLVFAGAGESTPVLHVSEAGDQLPPIRVLVVDDDRDTRELIRTVLETRGATVACSCSASDAIERLGREPFDALLADIAMPATDGYTLIYSIRTANTPWRGVPAVAVTACARPADAERAFQAGFNAFCTKPIDPNGLARTLIRVVAHGAGA